MCRYQHHNRDVRHSVQMTPRSIVPGLLMLALFVFVFSKLWWLVFFLPFAFFWFGGKKWAWQCEDGDDAARDEKRKNDDLFYEDEKPKRDQRSYDII